MHRSRLCAVGIDVPAPAHEATAAFWTAALGGTGEPDDDGTYVDAGRLGGKEVFVQRIAEGDAPRLHLDVETDDVEAEVARLEALGAERVRQVSTWWVLRDPAGNHFCVVRPQTPDFPGDAATWP